MNEYEIRSTGFTVAPKGEPIYSEQATDVRLVDESGGEYVEVCQSGVIGRGKIAINPEEWSTLKHAIDTLIAECRGMK